MPGKPVRQCAKKCGTKGFCVGIEGVRIYCYGASINTCEHNPHQKTRKHTCTHVRHTRTHVHTQARMHAHTRARTPVQVCLHARTRTTAHLHARAPAHAHTRRSARACFHTRLLSRIHTRSRACTRAHTDGQNLQRHRYCAKNKPQGTNGTKATNRKSTCVYTQSVSTHTHRIV